MINETCCKLPSELPWIVLSVRPLGSVRREVMSWSSEDPCTCNLNDTVYVLIYMYSPCLEHIVMSGECHILCIPNDALVLIGHMPSPGTGPLSTSSR